MNLFVFELKAYAKSLIFWSIGLLLMVGGGMAKYAGYSTSTQDLSVLLEGVPDVVLKVLGFDGFDITTAIGFYGVVTLYLFIMAAVHASLLGSDLLFKEEKEHTAEFLLAKPITRTQVITFKIAAGAINLILFNLITLLLSILMINLVAKGQIFMDQLLLLMFGMFLLQLMFFSVGLCFSAVARFARFPGGMATGFMLCSFLLSVLIDIYEKIDFLKYVTPFKYVNAVTIINEGRIEPIYLLLSLVIIFGSTFIAYRSYNLRDLRI